jgi:hypothetical protein
VAVGGAADAVEGDDIDAADAGGASSPRSWLGVSRVL